MKKLFVFLLLGLFLISFASAINIDNWKSQKDITFDGQSILGNKLLTVYKPIEINNIFGLGSTLFEGYISKHDYTCGQDCSSTIKIKTGQDGVLIDDIIFKTLQDDESWIEQDVRSYQFKYLGMIDDHETQCIDLKEICDETLDGTQCYTPQKCSQVKIGSHEGWVNYEVGEELPEGEYTLKLEAEKKPSRTVDWIIKTNGKWLDSWATWGNISLGDDAEVILNSPSDDYVSLTNLVTFNSTANISTGGATLTNMSLWTNETGSWGIRNITSSSGTTDGLVSAYYLDEISGTVIDSFGSNSGTNFGATPNVAGKIETAYDFEDVDNDFISTGNGATGGDDLDFTGDFSISAWVKPESFNAANNIIVGKRLDAGNYQYVLRTTSSGYLALLTTGGSVTDTKNQLTTGTFYHVVVTRDDDGNTAFYVNGSLGDFPSSKSISHVASNAYIGHAQYQNVDSIGYDGVIDEVYFFNKTLSPTEISLLYNSGDGGRPGEITGTQTWDRTITDTTLWNVQACDSDGDCGFATSNYTVYLDTTVPDIEVEYPNETLGYNYIGGNETLNVTYTDSNLDSCWYNYNGTNITIDGCLTGVKNSTVFTLEEDNFNMTIYANDSVGNLNSEFLDWSYKVFQNSFTFNNETRAGDQEDFTLNLTLGTGIDLTSATFNWNGLEESPGVFSDGQNRLITVEDYSVALYQVDTNVSVFFNLVLDNATEINTTNETQLVYAIFLDNCSTHTNHVLDINLLDEELKSPLLGDIQFNYELLNVPDYAIVNSLNMSFINKSSVSICSDINLTDENFVQSIELRYVSDGYAPELYHIQRSEISGDTVTLNLYDLNSSDSTEFKVTYQDSTFNFVEGAILQLQRKYISEGAYETVEAPLTSNEGIAVVHINLDTVKYRATVVKNGEVLDEFDNLVFKCQSELTGECEQKLLGTIDPQNNIDLDTSRDFSYSIDRLINVITLSFTIPSGTPSSINMILNQKDQFGSYEMCNQTILSSAGSIQCEFNDTIGDSYIDLRIYKDGVPMAIQSYIIPEGSGVDFLGNNFIIIIVLLLSVVGMALTSPEWIIINGIIVMVIAGALWLVNGLHFVMGLGSLMWLVIAAGILIFKLAKQEDR